MLGIGDYLWRLVPANPILLRVVEAGGKRRRDLLIRCAYLGLLVFVVTFSILTSLNGSGDTSLSELSKTSFVLFKRMSYLQLALVALLAPVFTAGAITQEKDSQTYDILLATPLTNGQIVLGSLLSRLFFVVALLVSGIPVFAITQIFGGVAIRSIVQSFNIAAATAFVTGAMAMTIATFKVGTRRTIFSFYFLIVLYLVGTYLLDQLDVFHAALASGSRSSTSWFTAFNPFLALETLFHGKAYLPPTTTDLAEGDRNWPIGWIWTSPASFYTTLMFTISFVLVLPSIFLLRRMAQSTLSFKSWLLQRLHLSRGGQTRKPRYVWSNPIAWREAKTKASAARATVLRFGFIGAGLIGAGVIAWFASTPQPISTNPNDKTSYSAYVDRDSYNADTRQLVVYTAAGATTYKVADTTQYTIGGQGATAEQINGKLAADITVATSGNGLQLATVSMRPIPARLPVDTARGLLLGLVVIEFAMTLLIVTNAAASTVTREKEDGTLDLLLTTPITSRYYIWGKLRGLVSFVLPLIAVPIVSLTVVVARDTFAGGAGGPLSRWTVLPESLLVLPVTLVIVCAFAAIVGMQMSLRCRTTVMAVMSSVAIVGGACGVLGWCGYAFLGSGGGGGNGTFALILGSFSPFTLLGMLIDPLKFAGRGLDPQLVGADDITNARTTIVIVSWVAAAVYTGVVWTIYKSMVTNFDMTIRRQSR